jgi:RHS repeat-associated protein
LRLADISAYQTTSLLTDTTNIDYLYDASGNMTRESGNRNLEYDYRQRTRLYFITNNTTLYEQYTYGADGHVVKRLNRSSGLIYSYVYIDGLFQYSDQIGHASNVQNHINILDPSGAIISQHRQGTFAGEVAYTNGELYMINNHVGSVIGTYDLNGTQQEGEDYYPFGDSSHHWNGNKQQRFAGKIRLSWTGYYDFGARQYIPWLAKFTSVDPLAAKSTDRNPYHYASNNPINRTDPTGMSDGKGDGKGGGESAKATAGGDNATTQKTPIHQVKKGETLSSIAKQHGTTVEKLREANNLDPRNDKKLQIGKELNLPGTDFSGIKYEEFSKRLPDLSRGSGILKEKEINFAEGIKEFIESSPLLPTIGPSVGLGEVSMALVNSTYNAIDQLYLYTTGSILGKDKAHHLTGEGASGSEFTDAGVETLTGFTPFSAPTKGMKTMNVAQWSKVNARSSAARATPASRGSMLKSENNSIRRNVQMNKDVDLIRLTLDKVVNGYDRSKEK